MNLDYTTYILVLFLHVFRYRKRLEKTPYCRKIDLVWTFAISDKHYFLLGRRFLFVGISSAALLLLFLYDGN